MLVASGVPGSVGVLGASVDVVGVSVEVVGVSVDVVGVSVEVPGVWLVGESEGLLAGESEVEDEEGTTGFVLPALPVPAFSTTWRTVVPD